ncbi:phosphoribosylformylglycinamidine cyclo-ligase, partial [Patescibacteria group bacterium]|nr:phosphoribosylformylglycinamidine cyclo-ligase [Patescibacteria group bacterium]
MSIKKITYSKSGVNYGVLDPVKKLAQTSAASTSKNLSDYGFSELTSTRGESAFVWKQGNVYMASVIEGLGTKNLVADDVEKITGKNYYESIAQDTVATIINDLSTMG